MPCKSFLIIVFGLLPLKTFAQSAGGLSIKVTTWAANLPTNNYGYFLTPNGEGCTTGDVTGSGAIGIICVNAGGNLQKFIQYMPSSVVFLKSTKNGPNGFIGSTALGTIAANDVSAYVGACAVADFDGDGRGDLACFGINTTSPNFLWNNYPTAWFSNGVGFSSTPTVNASAAYQMPIDVQYTLYGPQYPTGSEVGDSPFSAGSLQAFGTSCTVGHFMSGPAQQILCTFPIKTADTANGSILDTTNYWIYRYLGSGYSSSNPAGPSSVQETVSHWIGPPHINTWSIYANFGSNCQTGDFTGSGLTAVACPDINGNWNMGISTGTGFVNQLWPTSDGVYHKDCTTGDFNGDGKTDIACYVDGSTNPIQIYISTGSGFQSANHWVFSGMDITGQAFSNQTWSGAGMPPPQTPDGTAIAPNGMLVRDTSIFSTVCSIADLNGDGKTDIICYSNNSAYPSDFVYALSTGLGFSIGHFKFIIPPLIQVGLSGLNGGINEPFEYSCILGDFMGVGLPDILCNTSSTGTLKPYDVGIISRN